MAAYIVCYDLHKEGQNYKCLEEKLQAYGAHWNAQRSVWLIVTNQTAVQVRDNLASCLDSNDKLIVAGLSGEAAWRGYNQDVTDWLQKQLP